MNKSDSPKHETTRPATRTRRVSTAAAPRTRAPRASRGPSAAVVDADRIRDRAYELYLERGGQYGDPFEDWLRAERELTEQTSAQG